MITLLCRDNSWKKNNEKVNITVIRSLKKILLVSNVRSEESYILLCLF